MRAKGYQDVATGRFRSQAENVDQVRAALQEAQNRNAMIEEVLDKIRNENPDLDVILSKCLEW